jgi:hypothetical protein
MHGFAYPDVYHPNMQKSFLGSFRPFFGQSGQLGIVPVKFVHETHLRLIPTIQLGGVVEIGVPAQADAAGDRLDQFDRTVDPGHAVLVTWGVTRRRITTYNTSRVLGKLTTNGA